MIGHLQKNKVKYIARFINLIHSLDRISLAIGASFKYPGNTLIIDLGTCITYDLLLEGQYIGGQISPGISMRLSS